MNDTELRLGNLIDRGDYHCKVTGITEDGIMTEPINYEGERFVEKIITPIPLTEEWLIKLNFKYKKTEKSNSYSLDFFRVSFVIDGRYKGKMFISVANLNPDVNNFLYVHQLQNLYFALTGKEL